MRIRQVFVLSSILLLCSISCKTIPATKTEMAKRNKTKDLSSGDNTYIIDVPIVEKTFVNKKGVPTDKKEFYIQRSIQDYFIKFCESKVSSEELKTAWEKEEGFIKALRLEVEFKEGEWDNCGDMDPAPSSRIGEYVVIYKIY